jgi:hypothetical protein
VHRLGHLGVRGEGDHDHDGGDLVGRLGGVRAPAAQDLGDLLERIERRGERHGRPERLERERERRDDAEVAAAAADRPEEIGVRIGGCGSDLAVGADDLGLHQRVN